MGGKKHGSTPLAHTIFFVTQARRAGDAKLQAISDITCGCRQCHFKSLDSSSCCHHDNDAPAALYSSCYTQLCGLRQIHVQHHRCHADYLATQCHSFPSRCTRLALWVDSMHGSLPVRIAWGLACKHIEKVKNEVSFQPVLHTSVPTSIPYMTR